MRGAGRLVSIYLKTPRTKETATEAMILDRGRKEEV